MGNTKRSDLAGKPIWDTLVFMVGFTLDHKNKMRTELIPQALKEYAEHVINYETLQSLRGSGPSPGTPKYDQEEDHKTAHEVGNAFIASNGVAVWWSSRFQKNSEYVLLMKHKFIAYNHQSFTFWQHQYCDDFKTAVTLREEALKDNDVLDAKICEEIPVVYRDGRFYD